MKTPIQKGKLNPSENTMKTKLRREIDADDALMDRQRRDGQILKLHTPKK